MVQNSSLRFPPNLQILISLHLLNYPFILSIWKLYFEKVRSFERSKIVWICVKLWMFGNLLRVFVTLLSNPTSSSYPSYSNLAYIYLNFLSLFIAKLCVSICLISFLSFKTLVFISKHLVFRETKKRVHKHPSSFEKTRASNQFGRDQSTMNWEAHVRSVGAMCLVQSSCTLNQGRPPLPVPHDILWQVDVQMRWRG